MEEQPNSRMRFVCGIDSPIGLHLKLYTDDQGRCIAHFRPKPEHQGYDNRLEIISPGRLVFPVTLESLGHVRETRNKLIVRVLRDLGYIEDLGTGIRRIRAAMANSGLRPPVFAEEHHQFIITLYGAAASKDVATSPVTEQAVRWGLNERQAKALEYLAAYGQITRSEYSTLTGVAKSEAYRELQEMLEKRLVARRGSGRGVHYVSIVPSGDDSGDD